MSFGFGVRCVYFLKKLYLTDLSFVLEFGIEIGKDMFTITARHCVERFMASLGQDDGISRQHFRKIVSSGLPPGTESIFISFKAGVVGQNHQ
jgi:DNA-binding phage protein